MQRIPQWVGACLALVVIGTAGCSNRQVYDAATGLREQDCERYPPREKEECLQGARTSYDEYRQQRDDALAQPARKN